MQISQRERRVEIYRRDGRRWPLDEHRRGERVMLESLGIELSVDELYGGVVVAPRNVVDGYPI